MSKLKIYQWATLALLVINIGFIVFFLVKGKTNPNIEGLPQTAKKEMNLTDAQNDIFLQSAEKHKAQMNELNNNQKQLIYTYFKTFTSTDTAQNDSLITQLQSIEKQKIICTSNHFNEVKAILKPEQFEGFTTFLNKALKRIFKNDKKGALLPKE